MRGSVAARLRRRQDRAGRIRGDGSGECMIAMGDPTIAMPEHAARVESAADGGVLESVQVIARPIDDVFPFFDRPENLEAITPAWLSFRILTPRPVPMHEDARIDYRLRLFGWPLRWRTRIARYEPGSAFVDEQESGPFALWRHLHEFRPHPRGTWMLDRVEFRVPFGVLGRIVQRLLVGPLVRRIFEHRRRRIVELLENGVRN